MSTKTSGGSDPSSRGFQTGHSFSGDCVLHDGALSDLGYGRIGHNGSTTYAHIAAWERARGPVPDGFELDHLCNERRCVNVEHLQVVTHAENCRLRHERAGFTPRRQVPRSRVVGECSRGHALTGDNVYIVPTTGRSRCRQCRDDRMAEHRDRCAVQLQNYKAAANTDVRPTLDAHVAAVCADIVNRGRLGRPLPLPTLASDRVDELLGAAIGLVRGGR